MVYYRKYRPQKIEELDSGNVRDLLFSVLSSKDIAHAFLFTGPKGLGKTSAARIVAKAVNCERKNQESGIMNEGNDKKRTKQKGETHDSRNIEPCNECNQCISITNGTNIDVLEIDGASNRGIDEIRDLREKVRLSPAASRKKIYIIDEVHMLTTEAFNALLKTLEEPPSHVIFILCTTEPQKVPLTIISRCFHTPFKKADLSELVRSFQRIIKKEKLDIDENALNLIANLSDGSFRDGAKILEEMASFNKKITKELVEQKYQIRGLADQIEQMVGFLSRKNTKDGLQLVSKLVEQGVDMKYFIERLMDAFHGLLLHKAGVVNEDKFSIFLRQLADQFSIEETKTLIELLTKAYGELKYTVLPQLPLEMAIVEWGLVKSGSDLKQSVNLARVNASRHGDINSFWQELINRVKSHNHSIAGVLRGCILKDYDGKELIIETGYKFHKERLDDSKARKIIEKVCREISGKEVSFNVLLKE